MFSRAVGFWKALTNTCKPSKIVASTLLSFTLGVKGKETDAIHWKNTLHGKFLPGPTKIATASKTRSRQTC
jgi:hypothetical protein